MRNTLFILLTALLSVTGYAQSEQVNLSQAIAEGLRNNFSIQIARIDSQKAANNRLIAYGGFLPHVSASASAMLSETNSQSNVENNRDTQQQPPDVSAPGSGSFSSDSGSSEALSAELSLRWQLFDGFQMFYAYQQVHTTSDITQQRSRAQIESAVVAIAQAWFDAWLQSQLLDIRINSAAISHARWQRQKESYELGGTTSRQTLATLVRAQQDSQRVLDTELAQKRALFALNVAMGRRADEPVLTATDLPDKQLNGSQELWLERVTRNNAQLTATRLSAKAARLDYSLQRAQFFPVLSAVGSISASNSTFESFAADIESERFSTRVGLQLNWNIVNGFRTTTAVRNKRLAIDQADFTLEQARLQLRNQFFLLWETLENAEKAISFSQNALVLAKTNFERLQELEKQGGTTSLELREAQTQLDQAQISKIAALYRYQLAAIELEALAGAITLGP